MTRTVPLSPSWTKVLRGLVYCPPSTTEDQTQHNPTQAYGFGLKSRGEPLGKDEVHRSDASAPKRERSLAFSDIETQTEDQ